MYFDIETWFDPEQPKANMPHKAMMPVTSVVCYSNIHKKYWVMSWHPEHKFPMHQETGLFYLLILRSLY